MYCFLFLSSSWFFNVCTCVFLPVKETNKPRYQCVLKTIRVSTFLNKYKMWSGDPFAPVISGTPLPNSMILPTFFFFARSDYSRLYFKRGPLTETGVFARFSVTKKIEQTFFFFLSFYNLVKFPNAYTHLATSIYFYHSY